MWLEFVVFESARKISAVVRQQTTFNVYMRNIFFNCSIAFPATSARRYVKQMEWIGELILNVVSSRRRDSLRRVVDDHRGHPDERLETFIRPLTRSSTLSSVKPQSKRMSHSPVMFEQLINKNKQAVLKIIFLKVTDC